MCGIAGILSFRPNARPPEREQLQRMAAALRHRGPDQTGFYRDVHAGLAHTRLSIIDIAGGKQPLANEDGALWVTFNGEIFNYVELRDQLIERGHHFKTQSDTEVIVHAYEEWGDAAFERFNGQYAVGLWDVFKKVLVLARDPHGVRPLYVCEHAGKVLFASEVKAIFAADRSIVRELSPEGIDETFTFWAPIAPRTVFAGVEELPPGSVRTYASGRSTTRAPVTPRFPITPQDGFRGSLDEATEAVAEALTKATRLRMLRADVPVGSYLSGGLDSSLVAALGQRANGTRINTFSLRFEDAEYDEASFQQLVAQHIGSEHREIVVSARDIAAVFPDVILHTERPILRTAPAPLFLLSRLVRDAGMKVVLTGEGADEMFAGYDLFREAKVRRFWSRHPESRLRPRLLGRLYQWLGRSPMAQQNMAEQFFGRDLGRHAEAGFGHRPRWNATRALRRLFSRETLAAVERRDPIEELLASLPPEHAQWTPLARDQYLELRTLLAPYILSSQGDRMLMAHSVEGRFPFLDPDVAALAHSLPDSYKLHVLDEKHVLKRLARGLVPDAILARKKQPYRAPDALAFAGTGAPVWVAELLSESSVRAAGVFDPAAIAKLRAKCLGRGAETRFSNADNMAVVGVLSTQLLHHHFVQQTVTTSIAGFAS